MHVGTEGVCIQHLMGGIGFLIKTLTMIYCDDQIVIHVAKNPIEHSKMNHKKIHVHY